MISEPLQEETTEGDNLLSLEAAHCQNATADRS